MQHGDHGASIGIPVISSQYVEAVATTQKSLTQSLTNTIQRTLEGILCQSLLIHSQGAFRFPSDEQPEV